MSSHSHNKKGISHPSYFSGMRKKETNLKKKKALEAGQKSPTNSVDSYTIKNASRLFKEAAERLSQKNSSNPRRKENSQGSKNSGYVKRLSAMKKKEENNMDDDSSSDTD